MRKIEEIRKDFDRTDGEICRLLERRMELSREIAETKRVEGIDVVQEDRRRKVMERWVENCPSYSRESVERIYGIIHKESVKQQEI
ncbi:MAG: chorismate mutase [Paludibacteraceae bacterium]|nr:chorismate mutase [Paludibacteraceae bacterium]